MLATGLLLSISAASTDKLLPQTLVGGGQDSRARGLVRQHRHRPRERRPDDHARADVRLLRGDRRRRSPAVPRARPRLHRRAQRADPARPAAGLDRRVQLPVLRPDGRAVRRQSVPGRAARARRRPALPPTSGPSGSGPQRSTGRCSPRSATCWRRCRSPPACSPTRRSPPSRASRSSRWSGTGRALRGIDPVQAAALVGLNPLIVVYGVGGGHNDLLMLAADGRGRGSAAPAPRPPRRGARSSLGAAVKVTAGLLLPFALAGARGQHVAPPPARSPDRCRRGRRAPGRVRVRAVRHRPAAPPGDDREGPEQGQLAEHPRASSGPVSASARSGNRPRWRSAALFAVVALLAAVAGVARRARLDRWPPAGRRSPCWSPPRRCCPGTWRG